MNKHNKDKQRKEERRKNEYLKNRFYKGIQFDSIFEKEVAQYLDCCHINWERNKERYSCICDDKQLFYVPDFLIHLENKTLVLETKGRWFSTQKKRKTYTAVSQNNLDWILLMLDDWKKNKHILKEKIDAYRTF